MLQEPLLVFQDLVKSRHIQAIRQIAQFSELPDRNLLQNMLPQHYPLRKHSIPFKKVVGTFSQQRSYSQLSETINTRGHNTFTTGFIDWTFLFLQNQCPQFIPGTCDPREQSGSTASIYDYIIVVFRHLCRPVRDLN